MSMMRNHCTVSETGEESAMSWKRALRCPLSPLREAIRRLLGKLLTNQRDISNISVMACGCIRQALLDAKTALQATA